MLKPFVAHAQVEVVHSVVLVCFVSQVSRGVMPRRGGSAIETPNGWFEVIRGPWPPSVKWPIATKGQGKGKGKAKLADPGFDSR